MRPYRSRSVGSTVTIFPKANSEANCFARVPNGWPFSGASIPWRRTREVVLSQNRDRVPIGHPDDLGFEGGHGEGRTHLWSDEEGEDGQEPDDAAEEPGRSRGFV